MKLSNRLLLFLCLFYSCQISEAFEIMQPAEGQVFEVGSTVHVIVKPSTGEKLISVGIGFESLPYNARLGAFVRDFPLSKDDDLGPYEFKVEALTESKQVIELKRKIIVVLPSSVTLKSINVYPSPAFLYKLPKDSDPKRISIFETEKLSITGQYSDGITRKISEAGSTTYATSDASIVLVDSMGNLTAKGIGRADVTVKNSGLSVVVKVIVKAKNR